MEIANITVASRKIIDDMANDARLVNVSDERGNKFIRNNVTKSSVKLSRTLLNSIKIDNHIRDMVSPQNVQYQSDYPVLSADSLIYEKGRTTTVLNKRNFNILLITKAEDTPENNLAMFTVDTDKYRLVYYHIDHGEIINTYRKTGLTGCVLRYTYGTSEPMRFTCTLYDRDDGRYYYVSVNGTEDGFDYTLKRVESYCEKDPNPKDKYFRCTFDPKSGIPTDAIIVNSNNCPSLMNLEAVSANKRIIEVKEDDLIHAYETDKLFRCEMDLFMEDRFRSVVFVDFKGRITSDVYRKFKILYAFAIDSSKTYNNIVAIKSN